MQKFLKIESIFLVRRTFKIYLCSYICIHIALFYYLKEFVQTGFPLHRLEYTIFSHEHEVSLACGSDDLVWTRSIAD